MLYIKAIGIYISTFLSAVGRSVSGSGSITTEPLHRAICWRMAGAVSPAALSQIRSSVSQSWIIVSQAVCRTTRAILRVYQLY